MKPSHTIRPVFDDPNLVASAGLVPALRLAGAAGFYDLLDDLTVPSPNPAAKTASVVAGMLAGADCIDDLDLLRTGRMGRLFAGVRAPSTLGTFLRSFTHGHVQQLDKVGARLLAGLAGRVPDLLAGAGAGGIAFVDVDDTIREVHGYAKQAAGFGYTGVRGLNLQLATISTPGAAPVIARARLRRGNAASHTGAGRLLAQALSTAGAAGVTGQVLARADSAYYCHAFVGTALRHGAWFSVTARMNPQVRAAICGIDQAAWTPIAYPNAVWDDAEQRWISEAEVAEVPFEAFTSRRKHDHVTSRLVVRRVRRLQPLAGDGTEQGELFASYRHHAFITNSTLDTLDADQRHRDHAIIEQVIAELKGGPLAHLPSGHYPANAAWVSCAVIAFNLARATATAASMPTARWATLRTRIINIPRPDRGHRPPTRAAPAPALALGAWLGNALAGRDRAPHRNHHLTTQPATARPRNPKWTSRHRPAVTPRPHTPTPPRPHSHAKTGGSGLRGCAGLVRSCVASPVDSSPAAERRPLQPKAGEFRTSGSDPTVQNPSRMYVSPPLGIAGLRPQSAVLSTGLPRGAPIPATLDG